MELNLPTLFLRGGFEPQTLDTEKRTIVLRWSTGEKVLRGGFFTEPFYEELSLSPESVRMNRLRGGAPLLNAHSSQNVLDQIGVVEDAWLENGNGFARVRFSERSGTRAYTLEEPPYFMTQQMGSFIHAKALHDLGLKVKAMISLEMIGYFSDQKNSQNFPIGFLKWLYPTTGDFIAVVGGFQEMGLVRNVKKEMKISSSLPVFSLNAPAFIPGVAFSDHLSYWSFNYPAIMVTDTAFYRNRNYHRASDIKETLDFDKMAEVVKGIYQAVTNL